MLETKRPFGAFAAPRFGNRGGARRRSLILVAAILPLAGGVSSQGLAADVLEVARSFPDGGGYNARWTGSGTPHEIRFKGERILSKGDRTYCCGFTFAVAMRVAEQRNLLENKSPGELRVFQKNWYGTSPASAETQCAYAARQLGIGKLVPHATARPGDFVQLWRSNRSGHSAVFLGWIEQNGERVGLKYRGSQGATDGIGDRVEYFSDASTQRGSVDRNRTYFCRLEQP